MALRYAASLSSIHFNITKVKRALLQKSLAVQNICDQLRCYIYIYGRAVQRSTAQRRYTTLLWKSSFSPVGLVDLLVQVIYVINLHELFHISSSSLVIVNQGQPMF